VGKLGTDEFIWHRRACIASRGRLLDRVVVLAELPETFLYRRTVVVEKGISDAETCSDGMVWHRRSALEQYNLPGMELLLWT